VARWGGERGPAAGWTNLEYRRGDVRDEAVLRDAFAGADVVVHLAFLVTGGASADVLRAVNVDGTVNAFRAARQAGAHRFVYASSVAAYGFHPDNPVGMTEEWPVPPSWRLAPSPRCRSCRPPRSGSRRPATRPS
jgi:nucleoside-diphosphate-sugar epimerase